MNRSSCASAGAVAAKPGHTKEFRLSAKLAAASKELLAKNLL